MSVNLSEVFENDAVKAFGFALRLAVRTNNDYASMVELEYVEEPREFAETIKKFLRRFEAQSRRYKREAGHGGFRPSEKDLDELMNLVDKYGVRLIRAALISYALVKSAKGKVEEGEEE